MLTINLNIIIILMKKNSSIFIINCYIKCSISISLSMHVKTHIFVLKSNRYYIEKISESQNKSKLEQLTLLSFHSSDYFDDSHR